MKHGIISTVEQGSLAGSAGIQPGDELISINDRPIRDVIDFRFHSSDTRLNILLRSNGQEISVAIDKDYDDPLGIDFTAELFDGVRTCRNRCVFCFVDSLPRGMRGSLYLKDDDYRLSFLHSNFVTLSNVSEEDIQRIIEQRLSPLYVSVHATRPELRQELLRPRQCADIMPLMRRLAQHRIQFHTQIVLCPGLNDRERMDQSIDDLASLYPAVQSIGVVPVGLTKYTKSQLGSYDAEQSRNIIRQAQHWQRRFMKEFDTRLVFVSDEFYLRAGVKVPGAAAYEGYPQYENGIGIVRSFIDEMSRLKRRLPSAVDKPVRVGLITGRSAEVLLSQLASVLSQIQGLKVEVLPVDNDFFGRSVTVAGLLTGQDVISQLRNRDLPELLILPRVSMRDGRFLDDVTVETVASELQRRIEVVDPHPTALARAILNE